MVIKARKDKYGTTTLRHDDATPNDVMPNGSLQNLD